MRSILILLMFGGLIICNGTQAEAQLFGQRNVGRSRIQSPITRGSEDATPGVVSGTRRFIRGQRDASDFVGSDRSDTDGFVGSTSGRTEGTVVNSTVGLREQTPPSVNNVLPTPPRTGAYAPRITLGPGFGPLVESVSSAPVERSLIPPAASKGRYDQNVAPRKSQFDSIRVSVMGRTATLTGQVATAHDRQVAELLASFEPGVESIENQIRVAAPGPAFPPTTLNR